MCRWASRLNCVEPRPGVYWKAKNRRVDSPGKVRFVVRKLFSPMCDICSYSVLVRGHVVLRLFRQDKTFWKVTLCRRGVVRPFKDPTVL